MSTPLPGSIKFPGEPGGLDLALLRRCGALWQLKEEPGPGTVHAVLTSGMHSDTFLNMSVVGTHPPLLNEVIATHIAALLPADHRPDPEDFVVGAAMGGIVVAYALATVLGCRCAYAEKELGEDGEESMVLKRFKFPVGTRVLVCEDAVTTGGTTVKTARAVRAQGATIIPYMACIVNRTGRRELPLDLEGDNLGLEILSGFDIQGQTWPADECPVCKAGGKPLRPKQHWHRFVPSVT